jgi:hypothetical protein
VRLAADAKRLLCLRQVVIARPETVRSGLMASTYAGRLKKGVHYGTCGLPEVFDSPREMHQKATALVRRLRCYAYDEKAKLLKQAQHAVVFTVRRPVHI